MNDNDAPDERAPTGITRREALKVSGLALGGLALGAPAMHLVTGIAAAADSCTEALCSCPPGPSCTWTDTYKAEHYTYFQKLPPFYPFSSRTKSTIAPLGADEMRVTFMGSAFPPSKPGQQMMSVFVEVGWDPVRQMPLDQFVFDCGSGVVANYEAMNVGYGRMDKIFLTHLHADHMSDLSTIYTFGPANDRKSPLFIWGPGRSGVPNPDYDPTDPGRSPRYYNDGTAAFCAHLRAVLRWHSESFSFETSACRNYKPDVVKALWGLPPDLQPVGDDKPYDGYAMYPIELSLRGYKLGKNVAYDNQATGARITYFPVIHTRKGSIGYKLEWNGLTLIYTGDTKPERLSVQEASGLAGRPVDVFIHEMTLPPRVLAMKMGNISHPDLVPPEGVARAKMIENSSHTPQGAFGYLLSQIEPRPRLTVPCHFPTADDTVECAMKSLMAHCPVYRGNVANPPRGAARVTWAFDRMVITVSKDEIVEERGMVEALSFSPTYQPPPGTEDDPDPFYPPKYHRPSGIGDPFAQLDTSTAICACDEQGDCNYREDGF